VHGKSKETRRVYNSLNMETVMAYKTRFLFCLLFSVVICQSTFAGDNRAASGPSRLPPIETFVLEPIQLETLDMWVAACKSEPVINRSCRPKTDCSYACLLHGRVDHSKTESCPDGAARLAAEYAARYHRQTMPLTILNGWQWDTTCDLGLLESVTYDLRGRGWCWEGSWEALMRQTAGSLNYRWVCLGSAVNASEITQGSTINAISFSCLRARNGYPRKRQL